MEADRFLWLEDLESAEAGRWVGERNQAALAALGGGEGFARTRDAVREVLDSKDRIPYPGWRGDGFYYDFWTDAEHPRGLWRRTTAEQYRQERPEWDVLLDVDELNRAEGENWTWSDVTVLRPGFERCLVSLSRGGADAVVVREFDLPGRAFVSDGFTLPEAKSDVGWVDADHIFVATDFGPGSLTSSGYPRIVKVWTRGTDLADAETVFEGDLDDVVVSAHHDDMPGYERDFVNRMRDFFHTERFVRYQKGEYQQGELVKIDVPDDAGVDVHRDWMLVHPRSPWDAGGVTYPAGALLVTDFGRFLAGDRDFTVLFLPDEHTSLGSWSWTLNHLLLVTSTDVKTRVEILTPGWTRQPLPGAGEFDHTWIVDTDSANSDDFLIASTGYLRPSTLSAGTVGGPIEVLKQEPEFFDVSGLSVRQFFATSADGTRVPYFVVGDETEKGNRALLTGYGGFEIAMRPNYSGVIGRGWLADGGTYVVANIRGGGEYGPAWHRAALRENRNKAYEDFAAVAADLVERGITTPDRLGIRGGSNGGLLMGNMLTGYPELFGAIVCDVPLLDMFRYTKLLAGKSWIAEYGDPDDASDWAFLRAFSPYHNVREGQQYPPILFVTSTRDDRVHPGHARKMAALLLENGSDVTFYENVEGGHGAAADHEQAATIWALTLEFLKKNL